MPSPKLLSWATDIEPGTLAQAAKASRLPILAGHVALMPDAHIGIGATIGSVIPTRGAVIPSAVGVDLGCGMIAAELDVSAHQLPDNLDLLLHRIGRAIPAGVGKGHDQRWDGASRWLERNQPATELSKDQVGKAVRQFGTLGSGNHFVEVCLDERDRAWVVLHPGSRGIGNTLAQGHISRARKLARDAMISLEDPDLAWFVEGTEQFDHYIGDMLWAQDYARANRDRMMDRALREVFGFLRFGRETFRVNCHHNFCELETHDIDGQPEQVWVTRKGAIRARQGDWGIIPGSMGTKSYLVRGRGNPLSWQSCSHGAGRRLSRTAAKKRFTAADLVEQMAGRTWLAERANALIDEIPSAYKDIDAVMAAQEDLVEVAHTLHQILNYKGT